MVISKTTALKQLISERIGPMSSYVQVVRGDECIRVLLLNNLPRRLKRKIPSKFKGLPVVVRVVGSGNKIIAK